MTEKVNGSRVWISTGDKERIRQDMERIESLGFTAPLEARIIAHLLDCPRSPAELAELVYDREEDTVPHREYMRVSRALGNLESRGYVSRNMFGSPKPYKLTKHAISMLMGTGRSHPSGPITRWDVSLYSSTVILTALTALASMGFLLVTRPSFTVLYTASLILSGMCATRLIQTVRSVW